MAGGNISIVGPIRSGKTSYLAALAYHQEHSINGKNVAKYTINTINSDAKELKEQAEIILKSGQDFKATIIGNQTVHQFPYYHFSIEYKPSRFASNTTIEVTTRDYPGELFKQLVKSSILDNVHQEFINDCFVNKIGCVIMLSGWELGKDNEYRNMLKNFISIKDRSNVAENYKLAVVMSKCERGEIWPGRLDPEKDLFKIHLPQTKDFLEKKLAPNNLKFFALSTFGVMGRNNPRPNREDRVVKGEPASVLRDPENWKPYNLIEPLLWITKSSESKEK